MKAKDSDRQVVLKVEELLKRTKGKVSPADLSAETGFSLQQINDAMARLIELYTARVSMDSNTGKLVFKFNYPLQKRGKKTFKELFQQFMNWFWKIFKIVYKASIGVVLVFYTVIFVLILLALRFSGKGDNDNGGGIDIGPIVGGLFRGIMDAFTIHLWMRTFSYQTDSYGNRFKHYQPEKNKGRNFIQSVYSFVFGPERPEYDPLDDHKEAAAFIRKNNGKITAGHIVTLTGVSYDVAEERLAEYASRYSGDLYVNNDGILIGEFHDMLNSSSDELKGGKIVFYEDEVDPPYEFTGNSTGKNVGIIAMNSFNLIMSIFLTSVFSGAQQLTYVNEAGEIISSEALVSPFLTIGLGYFPLVFSIIFFAIPIVRYFIVKRNNNKREQNILRKKLIGAFVRNHSRSIRFDDIMSVTGINPKLQSVVKKILERLVIEMKGEINIDTSGNPVYSFPRLSTELGIR
ncbi:MAG: hypothetical protein KIT33_04065 [Candidatus Kapabacteria bacterium]|nr:hypothetical protein [Ignavibacteriota bacterium]MCW5884130.1 hypothetical protein [Candidatus Kapabacteria bacterium]